MESQTDGPLGLVLKWMALASGAILMLVMLGTVIDVVMRYVFNAPFRGSLEFTEFAMALVVWLSMAYCGWKGGHIAVDLMEGWLDRPALRWLPGLLSLVGAVLFGVMAWQIVLETLDTMSKVSNMMRTPHYPFKLIVAFGAAMFALVLLVQGLRLLHPKAVEKADHS
jgi:TRAP-type C4-dicarboxylate transport system permease small subunit